MDCIKIERANAPIRKIEVIYEPTNRPEVTVSSDIGWPPIKFQYHARFKGAKSWWTPKEARSFANALLELADQVPQTDTEGECTEDDCYGEDE